MTRSIFNSTCQPTDISAPTAILPLAPPSSAAREPHSLPSPFSCEVLYVGDAAVRGRSDGLCYDSNLTPLQARAIAVEAAVSKTGTQ